MAQNISINSKVIGIVLIIISIVLFVLFYSSGRTIVESTEDECRATFHPDTPVCPHTKNIPLQTVIGYIVSAILFVVGIYTYFLDKISPRKDATVEDIRKIEKDYSKILSQLADAEKCVFNLIKDNDGIIYQSKLIAETNYSKVKISRILDDLESKNLIERKRRGMSNIIVMK
ncbi:MAG: hypothetical protein V1824_02585 [archaeon]